GAPQRFHRSTSSAVIHVRPRSRLRYTVCTVKIGCGGLGSTSSWPFGSSPSRTYRDTTWWWVNHTGGLSASQRPNAGGRRSPPPSQDTRSVHPSPDDKSQSSPAPSPPGLEILHGASSPRWGNQI